MVAPRIYVACLAAYNEGRLHGVWIDAWLGEDHIRAEVAAMLKRSPAFGAEEAVVHDFEGFRGVNLGETGDWAFVAALAEALQEQPLVGPLMGNRGLAQTVDGVAEALAYCEDNHYGEFETPAGLAGDYLEETGQLASLPDWAQGYFDFDAYGRDMLLNDFFDLELVDEDGLRRRHAFFAA